MSEEEEGARRQEVPSEEEGRFDHHLRGVTDFF